LFSSRNWENHHGTEVFEKSVRQGWTRDEKAQERDFKERTIRQEGQEPEASDRDRAFRGESRRKEGPEEDLEKKEQQKAPL
jgi:hypothetical protein